MNFNDRESLERALDENSFALLDAALYLDTHPHDKNALEFFRRKQQRQQALREQYNKSIGPLTTDDVDASCGYWSWIDEPWPWQL